MSVYFLSIILECRSLLNYVIQDSLLEDLSAINYVNFCSTGGLHWLRFFKIAQLPHNKEHIERELKIRQEILTLKCNYNYLKICGTLWGNASLPTLMLTVIL